MKCQIYKHLNAFRIAPLGHFMLVLGVFFTFQTTAHAQDPIDTPYEAISYEVDDIEVDITADNAVQAREKAFEAAQLKGYEMLAARFLSAAEMESFTVPDIEAVSALVQDFEVTNERLSAVRYKGTYRIRFSERAFRDKNAPVVASTPTASVEAVQLPRGDTLLIPLYQVNGQTLLWENNPFMEAWIRARQNRMTGRLIVPVGDMNDTAQISGSQGLNYDPAKLNAMRLRYRADNAIIFVATPEALPNGVNNVIVHQYTVTPGGAELTQRFSVQGYRGEVQAQRYNRVVGQISASLLNASRSAAAANQTQAPAPAYTGPSDTMIAQLTFTTVRQWVEAKKKLERANGVQSVQVKSLSPRSATLAIQYQGGLANLRNVLRQAGMGLNDPTTQYGAGANNDTIYQLYLSPAGR